MSLHINLIMDGERRSASHLQPRTAILMGILAALTFSVVGIVSYTTSRNRADNDLKNAKHRWQKMEPFYNAAMELKASVEKMEAAARLAAAAGQVRLPCANQLETVWRGVPEAVQLTELRIINRVTTNAAPAQVFEMYLSGKTRVPEAEAGIRTLLEALRQPGDTNLVESAVVPAGAFRPDPGKNAGPNDRLFDVILKYSPKAYP